jgi:hypothetical protein
VVRAIICGEPPCDRIISEGSGDGGSIWHPGLSCFYLAKFYTAGARLFALWPAIRVGYADKRKAQTLNQKLIQIWRI